MNENPLDQLENLDFQHIFDVVTELEAKADTEAHYKAQGRRYDNIRASTIGYCLRRQYKDDMEPQPPIPTSLLSIFRQGNFIHDDVVFPTIEKWLRDVLGFQNNVKLMNEFPYGVEFDHPKHGKMTARGFVDDLLMVFHNGETFYVPVEIKSIGQAFYKLKEPELVHKCQVQLYMGLFGAKFGYVVYIHKGSWSVKTYKEEFDPDFYQRLIERGYDLYSYKTAGTTPPAEAMLEKERGDYWFSKKFLNEEGELDKDQCDSCDYLHECLDNKEQILAEDDEGDW